MASIAARKRRLAHAASFIAAAQPGEPLRAPAHTLYEEMA
jgi:hypothetical protein